MNSPLLIILVAVVVLLIVALIILRPTKKARHSRKRLIHKGLILREKIDHGARVAIQHGLERSPHWAKVAMEHRLREPACVVCGYKGRKLQVHHIKPFHLHPQLELDPQNLITLCEARGREHHLLLGHLDAWDSYNEHIRSDAKHFYRKTAAQIRADVFWQKRMAQRP